MGLLFFKRSKKSEVSRPADVGGMTERYNSYFPRLFAYVRTCVGGEMPAQDIVVQSFAEAFKQADADEERFRTVLFRTARHLCRPHLKERRQLEGDSLNVKEREILALVFDAGLTREQIGQLFRIRENTVSSLLMTGLRKLKEQTSPAAAAAYLKLS